MTKSNINAIFSNDIKTIWNIVTNLENYTWRTDLSRIEILSKNYFVEYSKKGYATRFKTTLFIPYNRWEFDMENDNMKGHWIGIFTSKKDICEINFTEYVMVKKTFLKPFIKLYLKRQQSTYIRDLSKKLSEYE
mgnify:CR=1 FL=1